MMRANLGQALRFLPALAVGWWHGSLIGAAQAQSSAPPALSVVATIKPIHALTAAVLGDAGKVELLLEGAASPHTYALKPSQVRQLHEATAVVMVSSSLETFMDKVVTSLPGTVKIVRLEQAPGLVRHPVRMGGLFDAHEHDEPAQKGGHHHGHAHGAKASRKSAVDGANSGDGEPWDTHFWLDPRNGKAIVAHIAGVLASVAPAQRAQFEANAHAMSDRLDRLEQDLARELQPVAGKPFIVFHDAFQYFEHRFGVQASGSITLNPDVQPGARRIKQLRGKLEAGGAVCVFAEPQFEPRIVETLIAGTKVRRGMLDPTGAALPKGPDAYEGMLRGVAAGMRSCLGTTS